MSSSNTAKCPVDHGSSLPEAQDSCPVDQTSKSTWSRFFSNQPSASRASLSMERETSSIPRLTDGNWVYPSEAQFFAAMARKNHNPQTADMKTIVPIHNAVNERAWAEVMKWEAGRGGEACGGVKLVNFKGKPNERSLRARWKMLLGYSAPFDRHDWVVDRCGTRTRYIIDFYTGHTQGLSSNNLSFFLDVRPAFDNWEGVRMRVENFFGGWFRRSTVSNSSPSPSKIPSQS
ncbi:cytochrome C1 heme lyase [Collybia nuda]|uniref:Holocytochrome c-type synthase n=1 Tax=Collybia nuda TaxID=64659 RepID=A0A9P6CDY6_9AGAR|nr:cytochrome C1 heme lyase [Collybia nuda]